MALTCVRAAFRAWERRERPPHDRGRIRTLLGEIGPAQLVTNAARAERAGFRFGLIWITFIRGSTNRARARSSGRRSVRSRRPPSRSRPRDGRDMPDHPPPPGDRPQASATCAALMPRNRFFLGLGTGENLNEHILGDRWPSCRRLEMLEEALHVIRELWTGSLVTHRGQHSRSIGPVSTAFRTPRRPSRWPRRDRTPLPSLGALGTRCIATTPDPDLVGAFNDAGGEGKPCYGQLTVCYAPTRDEGISTAFEHWANGGLGGDLGQELGLPTAFSPGSPASVTRGRCEAHRLRSRPRRP